MQSPLPCTAEISQPALVAAVQEVLCSKADALLEVCICVCWSAA